MESFHWNDGTFLDDGYCINYIDDFVSSFFFNKKMEA